MQTEQLINYNPWWAAGQIPKQLAWSNKRFFFDTLIEYLENPYILILTGLRRTGKTVLIYQTIEHLLKNGTPPENIFYFSFEDFSGQNLKSLIEEYRKIALPNGKIYCFFDEVHYCKNWSNHLKTFYDQRLDIKFLASGSSSHLLFKATSESLAGRVNILPIYPLRFEETIKYT